MYGFELGYTAAILDMSRAVSEHIAQVIIKQLHEDTLAAYEIARMQRETQCIISNETQD